MKEVIKSYMDQAKVGRKQSYKNLAVFPLLSAYVSNLEYLLLDEALAGDLIEILEIDKEGSVPKLKVINKSPHMVLILDGEELVGAKQNRVVNITLLISPDSTTVIPVSCVEQGRWAYDSPRFSSRERIMPSSLRAMKTGQVSFSIRAEGEFRADQGTIWDGIAKKAVRMEAPSPSMAMADIYEKEMPSIGKYVNHFRPINGQVGAVFLINGEVAGLDAFGKPGTFSKVFKKLVESYALDAIDWYDAEKEHKALKSDVTRFLKDSQTAQSDRHASVGVGTQYRLESKRVTGFSLALDEEVLHLSLFARAKSPDPDERGLRLQSYTRRRRYRE